MEAVSNNQEVVKLDFVEYLSKSFEYMHSCEKLQNDILAEDNKLCTALNILKKQYAEARENTTTIEVKSPNKMKGEFTKKIKTFFVKVWAAIVSLFEKIVLIVQTLIKSIIIFIQKKRISFSILDKHCDNLINEINSSIAGNNPSFYKNMVIKLKNKKISSFDTENQKFIANFDVVHKQLNGEELKNFINNNNNFFFNKNEKRNSFFNTNLLKEVVTYDINLKLDCYNDDFEKMTNQKIDITFDDKLKHIEDEINALTTQAILSTEIGDDTNGRSMVGYTTTWIDKADVYSYNLAETNKIKLIANSLIYGITSESIKYTSVNAFEFFGFIEKDFIQNKDFVKQKFFDIIKQCKDDFKLVYGTNGYIEIINKILKAYNEIAKNDSKNIKDIKNYINEQMKLLQDENENNIFTGRLKRFTNIVSKVNNVKNKFVLFRQLILSNIMKLITIEENALKVLILNDYKNTNIDLDSLNNMEKDIQSNLNNPLLEESDESLSENLKEKIENIDSKLDIKINNAQNKFNKRVDTVTDYVLNKIPDSKHNKDEKDNDESKDSF